MTPARWRRIEEVFDRAAELAQTDREGFVVGECGADADLRAEVLSLLGCLPDAAKSLREAVEAVASALVGSETARYIGKRLGPYRLVEVIGEGGMGTVYLAERDDAEFSHQVAIKILSRSVGSPQAIARFRDERQILAALEHPNIVRLLDGGSTDDELPYLVMEHVQGTTITRYAKDHTLSVRARLVLVRQVCAALQHAHQNLVVHRDIKPSNILVNADGVPKVLDFGIAKLLAPVGSFEREARTRTGLAMFTPEYASPEQARGVAISTATDVYSIGAVLYELVTGQPPHRMSGSALECLRVICEVEPLRPSAACPIERRRELAGDLDNIILRALHKDASRRYGSMVTRPRECGTWRPASPSPAPSSIRARCTAPPSAPMARAWSPRAPTGPRECGTSNPTWERSNNGPRSPSDVRLSLMVSRWCAARHWAHDRSPMSDLVDIASAPAATAILTQVHDTPCELP
jgi:eukaryotic-like serine/threonine-protein kinase